jgi:hypothetical protein
MLFLAALVSAAAAAVPVQKANVRAAYREKPIKLDETERGKLRAQLEAVVGSCSGAHAPAAAKRHPELEVGVQYPKPQPLATAGTPARELQVDEIILDATSNVNEGWPIVYVVAGRDAQQLDGCDSARISAALCTAALEHLAPLKVRESCRLTTR